AYSYYHSDSISMEMFDTLSSEYHLSYKIYFTYSSNNVVQRCILKTKIISYTLDLSYDSDLRCNGIECTVSLDSCSDKFWYLSETFNENGNVSENSIIPYFSTCLEFYNYGRKENYYYDENNKLIASKVFNRDSLDNWNIYVSKYYKYNSTNIHAVEKSEVKLYPNPALSELLLDNGQELIKEVALYDVMGKKIRYLTVNAFSTTVDVSDLPNGIYVVKINTASEVLVRKVQIMR
ncbi:MAG TPA: T9SS type A sorting domain-containing protein, partial [Bacteroidales bacterium]|nr:T9SS type A sorting domain-containing protein [Bacteroidales bacterium]